MAAKARLLQRMLLAYRSANPSLNLHRRRICVATTVENEGNNITEETVLSTKKNEEKIRQREAGKQLHAVYHINVDKIAENFLAERLKEEKDLSDKQHRQKELRQLEKEMYDRVIESVTLENERIRRLREERIEKQRLLNKEYNRERERLHKETEERQLQERIELVRNVIEESKNWVTHENLEEKITYCLEHETNYNFALMPTGEKIYSTSPPGSIDTEQYAPGPAAFHLTGARSASQELD